jgi:hypothetical protein
MKIFKDAKEWQVGFLQASGIVLYVMILAYVIPEFVGSRVNSGEVPEVLAGMIFLLIFSVSALICGIVVFAYPTFLALSKKLKEAIRIVLWTALFLASLLILLVWSILAFA